MTKIKKLLETVCHNCGKILVDEVSHPSWDGRSPLEPYANLLHYRVYQDSGTLYVFAILRDASMRFGDSASLRPNARPPLGKMMIALIRPKNLSMIMVVAATYNQRFVEKGSS